MANSSMTVTFVTESSDSATIVVELDGEKIEEVYGEDKTQFLYGEKAYFKIYKYPSDLSIAITQSDGTIASEGSGTSDESENITFTNSKTGSTSKPVKSVTGSEWLGNSLGAVSVVGEDVTANTKGVGILALDYTASFTRHSLTVSGKSEDEYPVLVYIAETEGE